jgi:hypothetical protein
MMSLAFFLVVAALAAAGSGYRETSRVFCAASIFTPRVRVLRRALPG